MKKKNKTIPQNDNGPFKQIRVNCGKEYEESGYGLLSRKIMEHKPACSLQCNIELGQVQEQGK